jgi:hypothetical protein
VHWGNERRRVDQRLTEAEEAETRARTRKG